MDIYDKDGEKRAADVYVFEDAAMFVSCLGAGATVRDGRTTILWIEGEERQSAVDSYDEAAEIIKGRLHDSRRARAYMSAQEKMQEFFDDVADATAPEKKERHA